MIPQIYIRLNLVIALLAAFIGGCRPQKSPETMEECFIINEIYTPSADEVCYFHGLMKAMQEAERAGHGVVQYKGRMVDYAMMKKAQRVLDLAAHLGLTSEAQEGAGT